MRATERPSTSSERCTPATNRCYNDCALPEAYGSGQVTVRLHATHEDMARRFNRTENVRPIPPSDPDFAALYSRRNDAESINRGILDVLVTPERSLPVPAVVTPGRFTSPQ